MNGRGGTAAPERASGRARDWLALGGWIALALGAGAIGGVASLNARDFFAALDRPVWAPPGWLFGPVWTALYVLMGVAAWLVWRTPAGVSADTTTRRRGLALFLIQLALNALWTWIFFAWRSGAWAFAEIVVLWLAIAATAALFARIAAAAAWLLAPYLAWVTYAAALTLALWRANGDTL